MSTPDPTELVDKKARRKRVGKWIWAAAMWVKNRRSAKAVENAIKSNRVAVVALTASVAAAGVGGYAVNEAYQAQGDVRTLGDRLTAVEQAQRAATAALASLEYELDVLTDSTAQSLRNLRNRADALAGRMQDVKAEVRNLPPVIDSRPATKRAFDLAAKAQAAAQQAQAAAQAAQENSTDPEARKAAEDAQKAAQRAEGQAVDAQKAAADANLAAVDAQASADQAKADAATALNAALAAQDKAGAALETADWAPKNYTLVQQTIGDGGTKAYPMGDLVVPAAGTYTAIISFQDGYGCNGDPFQILLDGVAVAGFTSQYGFCGSVVKVLTFNAPAGTHAITISVGCKPPGNGACVFNATTTIIRARNS